MSSLLRQLFCSLFILTPMLCMPQPDAPQNGDRELSTLRKIVRGFSKVDTAYIEPQHYNYTVMMQATHTYDIYRLTSNSGQSITLSPDISMKIGPYFGWRWFFLGYTFDLKNINFGVDGKKREIDFSIYSSQIGIDLFYRRTGSDYKMRKASMGEGVDVSKINGIPFDGINVGITGINVYYIFNHNRFSYPAAFSQSTCQKISQGSWLAGIGYMRNSLNLDYDKLNTIIEENVIPTVPLDSGLMFDKIRYTDINVSVGYAYNWVFAKNWLFAASASLAFAYKHSKGDVNQADDLDFSFNHVNVDGIGRFGLVYNNTRWYAGASTIVHSYNYRKSRFAVNNTFGSLNVYVGYNFGLKSKYKNKQIKD